MSIVLEMAIDGFISCCQKMLDILLCGLKNGVALGLSKSRLFIKTYDFVVARPSALIPKCILGYSLSPLASEGEVRNLKTGTLISFWSRMVAWAEETFLNKNRLTAKSQERRSFLVNGHASVAYNR